MQFRPENDQPNGHLISALLQPCINQFVRRHRIEALRHHHHIAGLLNKDRPIGTDKFVQTWFCRISFSTLQLVIPAGQRGAIDPRELMCGN